MTNREVYACSFRMLNARRDVLGTRWQLDKLVGDVLARAEFCADSGVNAGSVARLLDHLARRRRNRLARISRRARTAAYLDCGLVRGKDSLGRTIWE